MKFSKTFTFSLLFSVLISCDNEVDLAAEYTDTTVVYGLIDAYQDTQFVKINRAFLEEDANAITLASDPENFNYESLDVVMIREDRNDTFQLNSIVKPKDPGVFSTESNVVFYTDTNLGADVSYRLEITKPNGEITLARTNTLPRASIIRPESRLGARRAVSFNRIVSGGTLEYQDYDFIIGLNNRMARAEVKLFFDYEEEVNGNRIPRTVEIPAGGIRNDELSNDDFTLSFGGETFFRVLANAVPNNGNRKVVSTDQNLRIQVITVNQTYDQYTNIYGPLEGLAQVRPEFTNVENGIGLFASRSTYVVTSFLAEFSRRELFTGRFTGNLNFVDP